MDDKSKRNGLVGMPADDEAFCADLTSRSHDWLVQKAYNPLALKKHWSINVSICTYSTVVPHHGKHRQQGYCFGTTGNYIISPS